MSVSSPSVSAPGLALAQVITFGASSLQTEFGDGEWHKAGFVRLEAVPLDQDVEQSQGKANFGLEVTPDFVGHVLEAADVGQHGKDGFHDHAHVPFAPLAETQVGRMPIDLGKAGIGEDDHIMAKLVDKMLEGRAIMDVGCIAFPVNDAAQVVQHEAELAANNPTRIGLAFLADLSLAASLSSRMDQLDAVTVDHADAARVQP